MQVTVNGSTFKLDRKEVAASKRLALEQIRICREAIDPEANPSFYITYLLMLHLLSQDAIDVMDAGVIERALSIQNQKQ